LTNILEDHQEDLKVTTPSSSSSGEAKLESEIKLSFRGFEIKTVKLTVEKCGSGKKKTGSAGSAALQSDGWIKL
jgi:hypothetical protein